MLISPRFITPHRWGRELIRGGAEGRRQDEEAEKEAGLKRLVNNYDQEKKLNMNQTKKLFPTTTTSVAAWEMTQELHHPLVVL